MPLVCSLAIAALGVAILVWVARREHAAVLAGRGAVLDACSPLFDESSLTLGVDGFPRLEGAIAGHRLILEVIPDTMTVRRLPQLWLSVTLVKRLPLDSGFAVLVRPTGAEFYSLTHRLEHRLEPPAGLPPEVIARGADRRATAALALAAPALSALFAQPSVKEVGATGRGARIVFRVAEGRRGPHLLLRQCAFEDASLAPADLVFLHDGLTALCDGLDGQSERPPLAGKARGLPDRGAAS